ncbi:MAG: hypothetical protein PHQ75_08525 [Thermoguttaceae bacterium]|nr:hypothetical protein [Thermoguttaceae bacterium]
MSELFTQGEYMIRRKIMTLAGAKFHIYDNAGNLIGFSKQKAFKLKEDIRVYTNEDMQEELFVVKARNIIDFNGTYDVYNSKTQKAIGTWTRKGWSSMARDTWTFQFGTVSGELIEDSLAFALIRRFIAGALLPQDYSLTIQGTEKVHYKQNFNPFVYKLNVTIQPPFVEDFSMLFLAGGILLAAIEGKQN